ncbi:lamin tail domain-containing protein [Halorussus sp. MSC15.2]|uniref:lamin tail domain-containing protein n=1 Tax=Halorussus sp. MSC15.2 TaxID=2283638 RepID=UPI0013D1C03C|nr:lamin tail domain-containing protein [Halorussus sp. MSC15.2]NEU56899.1 MBL fold metallo-hydrolase [Halorussus sp. MSC15.2]
MNLRVLPSRRVAASTLLLVVVLAGCSGGFGALGDPAAETTSPDDSSAGANASDSAAALPESATTFSTSDGTLSVHFIHVGQGTSVLVVGPTGETLLYDTGNWNDDGEHVLNYLREHDVSRIDYLVTSHADADHVGGHAEVIDYYETEADGVGAIYDPGIAAASRTYEAYLDAVERHDVTLYRTQAGDSIPMAGASVRVLAPPEGYLADRDRNENSLVLRVARGNASVLLTGDAERRAEEYLTGRYDHALNATVLAAGHHGSNTSTGPALLKETTPRAVVVQSAYDSPYGHPHREVLGRLAERAIPTYWTGVHGTVVFETDGERVAVRTQRDAPTDPLELRTAPRVEPSADGPLERRATFSVGGDPVEPSDSATVPSPTVAPDGGTKTTSASGSLTVATVHADARGDEDANLNDEYVVLRNAGDRTLDLSGWTVADEAGHTYAFPDGTTLAAGETLTLRTGSGRDGGDYYWNAGRPVWNNAGDTVFVRTDEGRLVLEVEYDG